MYLRSARYYDALYGFKDYKATSKAVDALIRKENPEASRILDVACGTGKHLAELSSGYEVEGLDLNTGLLEIARARCPAATFHQGDMSDFQLDTSFDVITCLYSSISYVKTRERLFSAIRAMAAHLTRGGILLIEPWFTPETYWVGHLAANFVDEPDLKISWMYVSAIKDGMTILDIHYQVGTPQGVTQFRELHELGLFTREDHLAAFAEAGLVATYDEVGFFGRGLYVARAGGA